MDVPNMLPKAARRTPLMITISKKAVPPLLGLSAEEGGLDRQRCSS